MSIKIKGGDKYKTLARLAGLSPAKCEDVFFSTLKRLCDNDPQPKERAAVFLKHLEADITGGYPGVRNALSRAYRRYITEQLSKHYNQ